MEKIIGYKAFDNMKDRYGNTYELDKNYHVEGKIKWQENGFHFCKNLEDVFRYYDGFNDNTVVCMAEGSGTIYTYCDDYAEYYDMYVASDIKILKALSREEIINKVLDENIFALRRLVSGFKLTDDEINYILENCDSSFIGSYIDYYQKNDREVFKRKRK